jgi:DNA invertase Pin-like site-specific DNA recombinase
MKAERFVSYCRTSTRSQNLGIEAQRAAVARHVGDGEILAEYVEQESGSDNSREQLQAALAMCRLTGAVLIVARLDRLSRNAAFLTALMESGAKFVACDNPHANALTVHVLAALAQHELELIRSRTSAALKATKAKGTRLGRAPGDRMITQHTAKGVAASATVRGARARAYARDMADAIKASRAKLGADATYRAIAADLNARSIRSPRGCAISAATIQRAEALVA